MKAVFLDRDGTIIEDRGHLRDPSQVAFLPETFEALYRLQEEFLLFIVTNQSGIALEAVTAPDVDRVNGYVVDRLAEAGIRIADVYVCPHARSEGCSCIKPNAHFLHQAAREHGVDLRQSFTVGDHPHDVEFGQAVDAHGVYVLTGHGQKHLGALPAGAPVVRHIGQATERILTLAAWRAENDAPRESLRQAADVLRGGGTVAFPTETVYGLGANALDANAVAAIFEAKQRPTFDPLIVHVATLGQARGVVSDWPPAAGELARRFWPGPLTLVLPKSDAAADIVTAGLATVAVRMPDHPLALAMISQADRPIAAPSANRFGCISPTTAEHVRDQLGPRVDLVLDGGPCGVGIESTIISLVDDEPVLLRAGGTPVEEIEQVVGPVRRACDEARRPAAPGQLPLHYAPRTLLVLCDQEALPECPRAGLLTLTSPPAGQSYEAVEVLSEAGDLQVAATRFFAALHRLDTLGLDVIVATRMPEVGLGAAMNDRLRRAASKTEDAWTRKEKL
ncbi:MAG: threonylcarbamoyl-AMP synthase [Planctomycetes bacterium]|nr:threonylcarbamoyl-AMP synthase [Phycisphaerae bacterium]NBB96497.1 threonylcarbamoyl-AMP synthase [Planctomycetota bacterium]